MNNPLIFFGLCFIVLGFTLIYLVRRQSRISERDSTIIRNEWKSISEKISREPKYALLEGDKLLDFVLQKRGYTGSMSDKLIKAQKVFSHIDNVWSAHKLRNRVVHEVGFTLHEEQVRKSLSYIKQALWELGVKI